MKKKYVITGTKKELLKVETLLQKHGYNDDAEWNKWTRKDEDCNYISVKGAENVYEYHNHDCDVVEKAEIPHVISLVELTELLKATS